MVRVMRYRAGKESSIRAVTRTSHIAKRSARHGLDLWRCRTEGDELDGQGRDGAEPRAERRACARGDGGARLGGEEEVDLRRLGGVS